MKKSLIITSMVLLFTSGFSQTLKTSVFSAGGGAVQNADYSCFGTFGQPFAAKLSNSNFTVYEGFIFAQQNMITATITADETICFNTPASALNSVYTGAEGTPAWQWQIRNGSSWEELSGADTAVYDPGNLTSTSQFRLQITDNSGIGITFSDTVTVTVRDEFTSGAIETFGEILCYNGDPVQIGNDTEASGGDESITYQWQSSTDSTFSSPADIGLTDASGYDPPSGLTQTTWFRRQAKDATCNTAFESSTGIWKVTVYNDFSSGTIETTGETICYNGDPAQIGSDNKASGGDESITYQWQSSTDEAFTSPTDIVSSDTSSYDPPSGLTQTTWYRRQAKDATCNTAFETSSGTWKVTVYNEFTSGSVETTGETICYNGDPSQIGSTTDASGGDENITYRWQSSSDSTFTSPADISSSGSSTYDPPSGFTETTWYRRQAKDATCNTGFETSDGTWKVTVYEVFTSGTIESSGETICALSDPALIGSNTDAGGGDENITYRWQSSTDALFTSPVNISGTDAAAYDPPDGLTQTTWYRRQAKDATCNTVFETSSGVWKVSVDPTPEIPVMLAENVDKFSFGLSWNSTQDTISVPLDYTIDVATDIAFSLPISGSPFTVTEPQTSLPLSGLNSYTWYYFRIKAAADSCDSDYSGIDSVQTLPMPVEAGEGIKNQWKGYTKLKQAIDAVNNGAHKGNLSILIFESLTETQPSVIYASGTGLSDYHSITIKPGNAGLKTIQANLSSSLIDFNGADQVTIDGEFENDGQRNLVFINHNQYQCVVRVYNGVNTLNINSCIFRGKNGQFSSSAGEGGLIFIGGTATNTGNTQITLTGNVFTDDNGTSPGVGLFLKGTQGSENTDITVAGNEFLNFSRTGIYVQSYLNRSTLSENLFLNTISSANDQAAIHVNSTGREIRILANTIGTGPPALPVWKKDGGSFTGIRFTSTPISGSELPSVISGNFIGGIGWQPGKSGDFYGIFTDGNGPVQIGTDSTDLYEGNIISTVNQNQAASVTQGMVGIMVKSMAKTMICGNEVKNLTGAATGAALTVRGIHSEGGLHIIQGNSVSGLSSAAANIAASGALAGIFRTSLLNVEAVIRGNVVKGLFHTSTVNKPYVIHGIYLEGSGSGTLNTLLAGNQIVDLQMASPAVASQINGITLFSGRCEVYNNMIALGQYETGNYQFQGIFKPGTQRALICYNSVAIGGSSNVAGTPFSTALNAVGLDFDLKNNILQNQRTSNGKNYAIVTKIYTGFTSDYNDLFSGKAADCGSYNGGTTARTFAQWKTGTGRDANSVNVAATFTDPANGDLHSATTALIAGTPLAGYDNDFDGDLRSITVPAIGADEPGTDHLKIILLGGTPADTPGNLPSSGDQVKIFAVGKEIMVIKVINGLNNNTSHGLVQVYALTGQLMLNYSGELQTVTRFTLNCPTGFYLVMVQNENQRTISKVLITN